MAEPLTVNTIERLARSIFAQLSPLTGVRGTGTVAITAINGAGQKTLARNTYLAPIVSGQTRDDKLFKVLPNPDDADGAWIFEAGETLSIPITSNVGGARHNLGAGTVFTFNPPGEDFLPTATLEASIVDASNDGALLRKMAFFEELDATNAADDIFKAMLEVPGLMLMWEGSEPAEGMTAGLRRGGTRGGRRVTFMRESFVIYVIVNRLNSDAARRQEGLTAMQAVTQLLTDRLVNRDGEILSAIGSGIEIGARTRLRRGKQVYIYALRVRANQVLQALEERTFDRWVRTGMTLRAAAQSPDLPDPLPIVDDVRTMP